MDLYLSTLVQAGAVHHTAITNNLISIGPPLAEIREREATMLKTFKLEYCSLSQPRIASVFIDGAARGRFVYHGFARNLPGLQHTTLDHDGRTVGLHLDNWDKLPMSHRGASRTRLVINLGPGPRRVLYVPTDICAALRSLDLPDSHVPHTSDLMLLVKDGLMPLVYSVRVDPMCCYLMMTDAIAHDGSTFGSPEPSTTVHYFEEA